MSWGYLIDLRCTLATRAWSALKKRFPLDYPLTAKWSGFRGEELQVAFAPPTSEESFATVLRWGVFTKECLRVEKRRGDKVEIRVALGLDKSQLDMASYLGALLEGVRSAGGDGSLALVNDGSYDGEDGHTLVVRAGKRARRPLKNYDQLREQLTSDIFPSSFEDDDSPAPNANPSDPTTDTSETLRESYEHYRNGNNVAARDRIAAYFERGGAMNADLFRYYSSFLRSAPPTGDALETANELLLRSLREHPSLRANLIAFENAVAFLNENGRAAESVDLVVDAIGRGAEWSPALASNVARSAALAKDASRSDRLIALLRESPGAKMWELAGFLQNFAWLLLTLGDVDGAMATVERCLAQAPESRGDLASDDDLRELHANPRWVSLMGKSPP